jgi:basic membrane protein A
MAMLAGCGGDSGDDDGGDGGSEDGGSEDGGSEDGGSEDGGSEDGGSMESISAGWIYFAEPGDFGWTASHDAGAQATAEMDGVEITTVADVDSSAVQQTASQLAGENDIVFGASATFTTPMANAAEQNSDTAFEVASGIEIGENYGSYYIKNYHARYLIGYASGLLTEEDAIGYVAPNPIATVYEDINGFASGVQDANPDATVHLQWTNAFFDPQTSAETADTIISDEGVDVMAQHQDSPGALRAAADQGLFASGYAFPMGEQAGDNYLTTPVFEWEVPHRMIIEDVRAGEWEASLTFPGIAEGATILDEWGPEVPDDVISEVEGIQEDMMESDDAADDIVWGGTQIEDWTDEEILFDFVPGTEGFSGFADGIDNLDGVEDPS